MNRRRFIGFLGCGCCNLFLASCSTAPITQRRQLKILPEQKLNAQAADIFEKIKSKEKMSDDKATLDEIIKIGNNMEIAIDKYFNKAKLSNPTSNFQWDYILI